MKETSRNPKNEKVVIVDLHNRVLYSTTREKMRRERLIHRATYILIVNSKGEILIQKRSKTKDIYPGLWEIAAGGVVNDAETYAEAAVREVEEETGIKGANLKEHFDFYFEDDTNRVWGKVFSCKFDGKIISQKEEVEEIKFVTLNELFTKFNLKNFTPDSIYLLKKHKKALLEITST